MQPKDCILDIYGGFARDIGGWVPVAALIELLAALDIDEQAARAAIARMKRSDLLAPHKRAGVAGYQLTEQSTEILADGDRRLFRQTVHDGRWLVVTLSVPEHERRQRYLIKSRLARLGFGQGPANSWLAPASSLLDAEHMLHRAALDRYVAMWVGEYAGFGEIADVVAQAWDLDAIADRYRTFIETQTPRLQAWRHGEVETDRAFIDCLINLDGWRPLPYLDPGLPPSVTPPDWPAARARALFRELDDLLRPIAREWFVQGVINSQTQA